MQIFKYAKRNLTATIENDVNTCQGADYYRGSALGLLKKKQKTKHSGLNSPQSQPPVGKLI